MSMEIDATRMFREICGHIRSDAWNMHNALT